MANELYRDETQPIDRRVADLLDRMTVAEKVGQLVGSTYHLSVDVIDVDDLVDEVTDHGVGAAVPFGWGRDPAESPRDAVDIANRVQEAAVEDTRLGIPVLFYVSCEHGHAYVPEATVFPQRLAIAATRDPAANERVADVTATEVEATGAHQALDPVCDVARDPRWGRTFETYGESPFLCGEMGAAKVRGYQGDGIDQEGNVIATPKHFPAYSEPARGEDASMVDVSEYTFRRVFVPPFEAAIDAGAGSVMPCYNNINGYPVHGTKQYLGNLLRKDLDFDGFAVSDWGGVHMLHEDHRTSDSLPESLRQTVTAGLDVVSIGGSECAEHLLDLVEAGKLSERRIDESVRRVLRAKFRMGLFEDPYVDPDEATSVVGADDHRETSLEVARETMTLLKNEDDVLPLSPDLDEVFVTGPNADHLRNQFGGWSVRHPDDDTGVTVLEGIESSVGSDTTVRYEPGAEINDPVDIESAADAAAESDVAVVAIGEPAYLHEFGRSGENPEDFPARHRFSLPDAQQELVQAVHETGTPTVAVLVSGRPLPIEWIAEHVPAILMAYYPGSEGGTAVAETLFGESNPCGKLPISVPRSGDHLPVRFDYLPHPRPIEDDDAKHPPSYDPLFPFGHGLSYTEFEYGDLTLSEETVGPAGTVRLNVEVTNAGDRQGTEAVDVYLRDETSSRVRPVREHVAFDRIELESGESRLLSFDVQTEAIGVRQDDGERVTEPGRYMLHVGKRTTSFQVVDD